ncbi:unnamed protein product [Chrysoparadoxa australica]
MGWIFSCIDRVEEYPGQFPMAMMPLGTGNDLSRSFRWGSGFKPKMLKPKFLRKVSEAKAAKLDRWMLCVMPYNPLLDEEKVKATHLPPTFSINQYQGAIAPSVWVSRMGRGYCSGSHLQAVAMSSAPSPAASPTTSPRAADNVPKPSGDPGTSPGTDHHPQPSDALLVKQGTWESYDGIFCNYFSLGVDAVAAAAFHEHREAHPELFTSQMRNQMWYIQKGFPAAGGLPCCVSPPPPPLKKSSTLRVRDPATGRWSEVKLPSSIRGLIILNLQSYGGGRDLWGQSDGMSCMGSTQYGPAKPCDGILEIVGVSTIYHMGMVMGLNKVGIRAKRIAQASEVVLHLQEDTHMQIDGEPWMQAGAKLHIKKFAESCCLVPAKYAGAVGAVDVSAISGAAAAKAGEVTGGKGSSEVEAAVSNTV